MPFKKGQSGNPKGRPKVDFEVREAAREHGEEAMNKLVELMRGEDARVAQAAANAILDRAFGKPAQSITGADGAALFPSGINVTFVRPGS